MYLAFWWIHNGDLGNPAKTIFRGVFADFWVS